MSVHSAKGLEFDAIFAVGLEENIFPSFQSLDSKDGLDEERAALQARQEAVAKSTAVRGKP